MIASTVARKGFGQFRLRNANPFRAKTVSAQGFVLPSTRKMDWRLVEGCVPCNFQCDACYGMFSRCMGGAAAFENRRMGGFLCYYCYNGIRPPSDSDDEAELPNDEFSTRQPQRSDPAPRAKRVLSRSARRRRARKRFKLSA